MSTTGSEKEIETALSRQRKRQIQISLARWGGAHARVFPWRETTNASPYPILVAEMLLKRTTASAASKVYPIFVKRYPDLATLAAASSGDLENSFAPIGLHHQRSMAAMTLASYISERYAGKVPSTLSELLAVPGLGEYSARAILSFGFGTPTAVVDSNVARVIGRLFRFEGTANEFQRLADTLLPSLGHREHNFALLDLGALVCRYNNPKCHVCPLSQCCDSTGLGAVTRRSTAVGDRLRESRQSVGISQATLAREARVSKATIVAIEYGRQKPKQATMAKLKEAMGKYQVDQLSGQ